MNPTIHKTPLTNRNKVLFPKSDITKEEVFQYYENIANIIIPYLKDRPLTMQRFPKGINEEGFFQKNAPDYFPDWISTSKVKKKDGWVNHIICNSKEILLYLVNQYVLTFHVALSKIDKINYPDKMVFDIDPPKEKFQLAVKAAKALHHILEEKLKLKAYVMTSGSKGLHIVVPIKATVPFERVHSFSKQIANYICNNNPTTFTTAIKKDKREGRCYIDYLRNSYAQTSVVPFSIRALEKAPVATPLHWNELDNTKLNATSYNIDTIFERLEKTGDPWQNFEQNTRTIDSAIDTMETLVNYRL